MTDIKASHLPLMGLGSRRPDEISWVISGDCVRVPTIRTVDEGSDGWRVGPVKFCSGPRVYYVRVKLVSVN
jgi:hypothetical protein